MDAEECRKLHEAIEDGDVDLVSRLMENHAAEQYFLHEGDSALYHAFSCKEYEIAVLLISKGAILHESEYGYLFDVESGGEIDLTRVNHLLLQCNKKSDISCIDKLMSVSRSRQGFDGPHRKAVRNMYKTLFESEIIKLLMMVLETVALDVFYDFESEDVNRLHRLEVEEMEIYGLTLSNSKEIFVGAKNLMSGDPKKRAKVYGVVAEELCHLAMTSLFENGAKPYREDQSKLSEDFWNIITAVKSLSRRSCHLELSIQTIFTDYEERQWECELIARVPYVIGFYGEETGRGILLESSELSKLLSFYEENVIPKCRVCTDPRLNTTAHRIMEELMKSHDLISSEEKTITPLKEGFSPFSKYLQDFPSFPEYPELKREKIFVLTTNCTKLCTLHVFHELKEKYGELLNKKVLFFSRNCIEREKGKIVNSLKGSVWDYLIIVMNKKALNLWSFNIDYVDYFNEFLINGMKMIMITSSQSIDQKFNFERAVNYKWDDLTYEYKDKLEIITFLFKGQEEHVHVKMGDFHEYFDEDVIMQIIGEVIEVDDGKDLYSQGYVPETYIKREFTATTVDGEFFDNIPRDTSVFLSGFSKKDFEEGLIKNIPVQWLEKSYNILQEDKSVYISRGNEFATFMDLVGKNQRKTTIWLHHEKKLFYLKNSNLNSNEFKILTKEVSFSEKEILDFLKIKRILIISDNAGCGKSTVVSNLISTVRKNRSDSWIWRIDFNNFSNSEKDHLSLANLHQSSSEEEVIDHLCQMLRLNGGFEKHLFKKFSESAGRCFIFFDGYDEIPSKYINSALKILSTLKENTEVKLIITTRKHHQEELEKTLDTYSHRLVPLSKEYQKEFLNKLWKNKLKDPKGKGDQRSQRDVTEKIQNIINESKKEGTVLEYQELIHALEEIDLTKSLNSILSDIENLDFTKFAELILEKSSLDKETLEFIGIPLHFYMIGIINFNNNFNVETAYDIYSLYKEFLDQKILIYIEEKHNLRKEGEVKEEMKENKRKEAFRIHTDLSIQLIDEGKVCLAKDLKEKDLKLCIGLGVVYEHGGEVRFLHQTFAEFFIAESVRKNLRMEDIIKLISNDKYKVIRRFLSSSLENNSFEKVSKECYDISCLSCVMKKAKILVIRYDSDSFCSTKIIKSLLVNFEQNVEVSVVNKLLEKIESRIASMSHVGGFLTVPMMKHLLNRSFEDNSIFFLHFVRFAESADDVIDVLTECILFGNDGRPGSSMHKRIKKREEDIHKEDMRLLLLLSQKDYFKKGLLHHAMRNEKVEIFARTLKFFRDAVGKIQFLERIIISDQYKTEICDFMLYAGIDKFCTFINALHDVFDSEKEILIDNDLKFMLSWNTFDIPYLLGEDTYSLQKEISIFPEYFDSEQLKEFLLSCDSKGDYHIHNIITVGPFTEIVKMLNEVEKVLKDNFTMKQFLRMKNKNLSNALHLAVLKNDFDEIIQLFDKYLEKEEMKEMLLSKNKSYGNVMHMLINHNSPEEFIKNLNIVRGIVGDDSFKELLKSKNSDNKNIFHFEACINRISEGIIQICENILGKDETKELLLGKDKLDHNVIHLLIENNSPKILTDNLNSVIGIIGDECFKHLLKSKNSENKNIFHFAACNVNIKEFTFLSLYLCEKEIADLLSERTVFGQTCLHFAAKNKAKNVMNVTDVIDYAHHLLRCDSRFEEFLQAQDADGNTFFHSMIKKDYLTTLNICRIFESTKHKLSIDVFNKLLRVRNNEGKTFLRMDYEDIERIIKYFEGILEKDLFEELLKESEM